MEQIQIWNILELEPTRDTAAIKRAYAKQTRKYHPEDDPERFLKLRNAYQAAIDWAEKGSEISTLDQPVQPDTDADAGQTPSPAIDADDGWVFHDKPADNGPNPYKDHEANRRFMALYTGSQRKNPKSWMDYFTSAAFLNTAWESPFTALLLQNVTELEQEYPPTKEFLSWLYTAYQFSATASVQALSEGKERREIYFQLYEGAAFEGIDSIFQIASKGPIPKRPSGNELAMLSSFSEYRHLMRLAEKGNWNEQAIGEFSQIISRYVLAYLKDKCVHREKNDVERHPSGLRLLIHFFENHDLPEELYRILWKQLDLKNATMGRTKLFYGRLRELVLEHVPGIEGEAPENFFQLNRDFTNFCIGLRKQTGTCLQKGMEEVDAFFAREDFQRALRTRRFVEQNILGHWVTEYRSEYFLQRIINFYTEHSEAPYAEQAASRAAQKLMLQSVRRQIDEDREAAVPDGCPTLTYRPFFRHWLNTGFPLARDPESGRPLWDYLNSEFPYIPEWSRRFLNMDEECAIPTPKCITALNGGTKIEIRFHLRYMDFLIDGARVLRPCLRLDCLAGIPDNDLFFFLLPIAAAPYDQYETAKAEILRRLKDTAAPESSHGFLAACLAGTICRLPVSNIREGMEQPGSPLPMELLMEDGEKLYGCSWFQAEETLLFFEQTPNGRRNIADGEYTDIRSEEDAVALAEQLLKEAVSPSAIHVNLLNPLPKAVYVIPDFSAVCHDPKRIGSDMPRELLDDAVIYEKLEELFTLFADGKIKRLELSWPCILPISENQGYEPRRSLVFLKDEAGQACLYFDDSRAQAYTLLARPEMYWNNEHTELNLVPFLQGKLFNYDIHRNFSTIRRHLDTVFRQASFPNGITLHAGRLWSSASSVAHGRHKYNLDKQLLGGFPVEWAHNRLDSRFFLSAYPDTFAYADVQGHAKTLPVGGLNRDCLQQILISFVHGRLSRLRMTWGRGYGPCHIVLLQDQGRFIMAFLNDKKQQAEFYVADVKTYLDVEGKKYPKDTFLGRTVPAYLLHSDMTRLRNGLELLLANMDNPSVVINKFAEFAAESPAKPRDYSVICNELLEDL